MGDSRSSPAASAHRDALALLSAGTSEAPSLTTNTTARSSQGTDPTVSGCLPRLLRGWNLSRRRGMWRLPRQPPAHQTSGCCSLPPPLSKASRRRRSTRSPCLRAGRVSRQAVFKSDSAGLEWDVGFSTFVLLRSRCSSELCGSFWLHTVPGSFTDLSLRFPAVPLCCFCSVLSLSR